MNNVVKITNELGEEINAELIKVILLDEYPGKKYVLYSLGEKVDEDNEIIYAAIYKEYDNYCRLETIEDKNELEAVKKEIDKRILNIDGDVDESK